jgi:hypothetical protein
MLARRSDHPHARRSDRIVWAVDAFEGLPTVKEADAKYKGDSSVAGLDARNDGGRLQLGLAVPLDYLVCRVRSARCIGKRRAAWRLTPG